MLFKKNQGVPLLHDVSVSMDDNFLQRTSPLTPNKLNRIKYQLCGPWNYEKVNQKTKNKIKYKVVVSDNKNFARYSRVSVHRYLIEWHFSPKNIISYCRKSQYNQISTLWTLKRWENEPKNNNKIIILRCCEWFLRLFKGFPYSRLYMPQL